MKKNKQKTRLFIRTCGFCIMCLPTRQFTDKPNDPVYNNLDQTVSPGADFFKYANGGWIKKNPIPPAYSSWGIGNVVQEEIRERLKNQ